MYIVYILVLPFSLSWHIKKEFCLLVGVEPWWGIGYHKQLFNMILYSTSEGKCMYEISEILQLMSERNFFTIVAHVLWFMTLLGSVLIGKLLETWKSILMLCCIWFRRSSLLSICHCFWLVFLGYVDMKERWWNWKPICSGRRNSWLDDGNLAMFH